MYKIRHEQMPRLPRSLNEIDLQDHQIYTKTTTNRRFLLSHTSNDLIIFSSDYQLEILSQAERWHIDDLIDFFCNVSKYFYYKYSLTFSNFKIWELVYATDLPKQTNSYDCGMYVCKFAEFILKNRCFTFNDASMIRYRQKLLLSILRNKIL
jgi:Ulp1 family protease